MTTGADVGNQAIIDRLRSLAKGARRATVFAVCEAVGPGLLVSDDPRVKALGVALNLLCQEKGRK